MRYLSQSAKENHGDHDGEEEDDHERVRYGEPMHLFVRRVGREINIPTLKTHTGV